MWSQWAKMLSGPTMAEIVGDLGRAKVIGGPWRAKVIVVLKVPKW